MRLNIPEVGAERDTYILDRVVMGQYDTIPWATIRSTHASHTAEFNVMADALKFDGVRINVSAEVKQRVADALGCLLLTPKLADLMWIQRSVTLVPSPQKITSSSQAMNDHSARIDQQLERLGNPTGLIVTVGKLWVIDQLLAQKPQAAMNYGWWFEGQAFQGLAGEPCATLTRDPKTGQYYRVIQGRGTRHDRTHTDYSQVCVLVARQCTVDGVERDLEDVLGDEVLAPLASHQGKMTVVRQPGVPISVVGSTVFGRIL